MRRQRNTQQMKQQCKNPPDQTNVEEIGSLTENEFRVMIVKMINILEIEWRRYKKSYKDQKELTNNDEQQNK